MLILLLAAMPQPCSGQISSDALRIRIQPANVDKMLATEAPPH
jgi:hypothetical protein